MNSNIRWIDTLIPHRLIYEKKYYSRWILFTERILLIRTVCIFHTWIRLLQSLWWPESLWQIIAIRTYQTENHLLRWSLLFPWILFKSLLSFLNVKPNPVETYCLVDTTSDPLIIIILPIILKSDYFVVTYFLCTPFFDAIIFKSHRD